MFQPAAAAKTQVGPAPILFQSRAPPGQPKDSRQSRKFKRLVLTRARGVFYACPLAAEREEHCRLSGKRDEPSLAKARWNFTRKHHWQEQSDPGRPGDGQESGAHDGHGAHYRRQRHWQGADCPWYSRPQRQERTNYFCRVNCGALPETLLESLLFGPPFVRLPSQAPSLNQEWLSLKGAWRNHFFLDEIGDPATLSR